MMLPRISASSYSNTAPLIWSFLYGDNRRHVEIVTDNAPARSAELLAQNAVDAALVPVIEYQRIQDARLVPDVCVGARERVRSVCLVTKGAELSNTKTVALDVSSRTSVALTKIIFREFLGKEPTYRSARPDLNQMLDDADCALLIGDPALTVDKMLYRKFDLAETWRSFTGFGFVFAMWMARAENLKAAKEIDFAAARDEGLENIEQIVSRYQKKIALSREEIHDYLTENISYSVDDNMQKGLSLFFRLAHRHDLIDSCAPLRFIGD